MSEKGTRGIIYLMESAIPGLVKIGKCGTKQYKERMRDLSSNGYRNATGLKCVIAMEVDNYEDVERLFHSLFDSCRVGNTELFALDVSLLTGLFSALDGTMKYPHSESKSDVFDEAASVAYGRVIPDGEYRLTRFKQSDNRSVDAIASITNNYWTIKKDSVVGISEDNRVSDKARNHHNDMVINKENGKLLEDYELGECSPSLAASVVLFGSTNGWKDWEDEFKRKIDYYRQMAKKETEE